MFREIFRQKYSAITVSKDLPAQDAERLRKEMLECLHRRGGEREKNLRAIAIAEIFHSLSINGKKTYSNILSTIGDHRSHFKGDDYSQMEEAEFFGKSNMRRAILEIFESPSRRLCDILINTPNGLNCLTAVRKYADKNLEKEIDAVIEQYS